jgi:hypothetical protein
VAASYPSDHFIQLLEGERRTSIFFPRTALKQGSSLNAMRTLVDRYVQLRLIDRADLAQLCVSALEGHLDVCRNAKTPLEPFIIPQGIDQRAFIASVGLSMESIARSLTLYSIRRFDCILEWLRSGKFADEHARGAIHELDQIFQVHESLGRPTHQDQRAWEFLRLLLHVRETAKAREYCLKFWPREGTWLPRHISEVDPEGLQTNVLRVLSWGKGPEVEPTDPAQTSFIAEVRDALRDQDDLQGIRAYGEKLEYVRLRRVFLGLGADLEESLNDLRRG